MNLKFLCRGPTLDVGCGIGRNLRHLPTGSLGVDPDQEAVRICQDLKLPALTDTDFFRAQANNSPLLFDSLLFSHVLEHLSDRDIRAVLTKYLPSLKPGGTVVVICPQERGFQFDSTHVNWLDSSHIRSHLQSIGIRIQRDYSFPFPRVFGRFFVYNEFVVSGLRPTLA